MKLRIAIFLSLLAGPAYAADAPKTLIMPTGVIAAVRQFLGKLPHDEVDAMTRALEDCTEVQVPNAQGAIMSHGQCPAVTEALNEAAAAKAKADAPAASPEAPR